MTGRNWTELFFLDEAVALAAGHRPCGYCRRAAYGAFVTAWHQATGNRPTAKDMDRTLHPARVRRDRRQVRYQAAIDTLPSGTFVLCEGKPCLLWDGALYPYAADGYRTPIAQTPGPTVTVLTPEPTIWALSAGYVPQVALSSAEAR